MEQSESFKRAHAAVTEARQKQQRIAAEMAEITAKTHDAKTLLTRGETERLERLPTGFERAEAEVAELKVKWGEERGNACSHDTDPCYGGVPSR